MAAPAVAPSRPGARRRAEALPQSTIQALRDVILPMPLWKRTIDIVGAAVLIAVLSPVLLLVGIAVAIESPGGPIFRQVRVGKGGRTFVCWKFRSMRRDAEQLKASLVDANEANGHLFKMKNDPRRTRVGVVIRKTSLDELPQLWNVLRGEMSLVGPRPPVPEEVERYEPHDLHRLVVEPGITGLWQVTARQRHHFPEMVALDIEYAERRSLGLDLRIALKTIGTVVKGSGSY